MGWQSFAATALIAVALMPRASLAAQLKEFSVKDEGKKARAVFTFSESVKAEVISHYANNFVALSISGLGFSKSQTRADHKASQDLESVYRFVRCVPGAQKNDPGEIRIYLAKPVTPADALVVQNGKSIEIEILKPRGSKPSVDAPEEPAWPEAVPPSQPEAEPVEAVDPSGEAAPGEAAPAETLPAEPEPTEPAEAGPEPPAAEETPPPSGDSTEAAPAEGGQTPLGQLPGGSKPHPAVQAAPEDSAAEEPAPEEAESGGSVEIAPSGRSYQSFDLTQVPVNGVEIKNEPFNQALMELVAGTGFNVVVGEGVSTETVTLNFSKKQISLKSALDLLCVAYDLVYNVEDDAIVIRGKP